MSFKDIVTNRKTALRIVLIVIGAAALAGALLCKIIGDLTGWRTTLNYTDEQILDLPYFELLVPADENRNVPCDIVSYSLGDGFIHLVLPQDVNEKRVTVYIRDQEGNCLARRVYDLSREVMIGEWKVLLEHHVLPTVYYESDDPDVYSAMISSETKDTICEGKVYIEPGKEDEFRIGWLPASIRGRGASSWEACKSKKSYSLRLDRAVNLLGLGSNRSWNLIGNAFDVSLIRNVTFNRISQEAGIEFQPHMLNVNLYVDGKYQGVYTITTKLTVDKKRVALHNGDLFYRKQPDEPVQAIPYESSTWENAGADEPVAELIFPENATEGELLRAQEVFQRFISSVEDPTFADLADVCDIKSLAEYYWIQEASMNIDAWERGVYMFYRESDGKMHMGPVWDMDLTLGSPVPKLGVEFDTPEGWKIRDGGWYPLLFENKDFASAVREVYYNGGVRQALQDGILEFEEERKALGSDGYMNYLLYGHANEWEAVFDHGDTYDRYCDNMIDFYRARVDWIDAEMERSNEE